MAKHHVSIDGLQTETPENSRPDEHSPAEDLPLLPVIENWSVKLGDILLPLLASAKESA